MVGSIPEVPAESCAENTASERDIAVSGNYWILSFKLDEIFLSYCNMLIEDIYGKLLICLFVLCSC